MKSDLVQMNIQYRFPFTFISMLSIDSSIQLLSVSPRPTNSYLILFLLLDFTEDMRSSALLTGIMLRSRHFAALAPSRGRRFTLLALEGAPHGVHPT